MVPFDLALTLSWSNSLSVCGFGGHSPMPKSASAWGTKDAMRKSKEYFILFVSSDTFDTQRVTSAPNLCAIQFYLSPYPINFHRTTQYNLSALINVPFHVKNF